MSDAPRNALLPPNQSRLETALANAAGLAHQPRRVADLWNADACPPELLPWLAWALHVDNWDNTATDAKKRAAIRESVAIHRKKGTLWSIKKALATLGLSARIREWFEYGGEPYHFRVDVQLEERGIDDATFDAMVELVTKFKNARSHLDHLNITLANRSQVPAIAAATLCGELATVYPYELTEVNQVSQVPRIGIGHWSVETVSVYPQTE